MLGFFGKKGKEIINSDSNGVTSKNSLPMPKETLNLQGSSGFVMESGIQNITLGVFSLAQEAINTDSWIKDEDEQKFEEKISRSLKHFNSQSEGNNDQDPTLDLNSFIRDGCPEEESFGIQDDIGINSAVKNIEILKGILLGPRLVKISGNKKIVPLAENVFIKGEDMEVYEKDKYWNLDGSIFELRSWLLPIVPFSVTKTLSELNDRRCKGLHLWCDEQYTANHNCHKAPFMVFDFDEVDVKEPASKEFDAVEREKMTTDLNISKDSHLAGLLDPKGISGGHAGYPGPSIPVVAANVKAIAKVSANGSVNHLEGKELLLVENNLNNQSDLLQDSNDSRNVSHKLLDMVELHSSYGKHISCNCGV
ncbi:hypothetical protein GH714_031583 [Hevea brasiliensis]|uniref:Uncharacterized protein n=1 Tax=Hevea brasiliensis TaxID=3981 RepID=A0A6A6LXQ3_HEVBR|nr:hypothetical protein GH714_031583 [Hevea brasiliensis]